MKNQNKDVKFIIYQVLYIFIIAVMALKGAELSLSEVIDKSKVVNKTFADSLMTYADSLKSFIDSVTKLGLVPRVSLDYFADADGKLYPQTVFTSNTSYTGGLIPTIPAIPPIMDNPGEQPVQEPDKVKQQTVIINTPTPPSNFMQYCSYSITNPYSETLIISADGEQIASISPSKTVTIKLSGQKTITYTVSGKSSTSSIKDKPAPTIDLKQVSTAGKLSNLQQSVGFRLIVNDPAPEQLRIDFKGPVSVKQIGNNTWDITLKFLGSKSEFDKFFDDKDLPYRVSFSVNVKDASGKTVNRAGSFEITDW